MCSVASKPFIRGMPMSRIQVVVHDQHPPRGPLFPLATGTRARCWYPVAIRHSNTGVLDTDHGWRPVDIAGAGSLDRLFSSLAAAGPPTMTGHRRWVRLSHWILAASVLTLAVTGFIIL